MHVLKNFRVRIIGILVFVQVFSGCFAWRMVTRKKVKKAPPRMTRMFVMDFSCDNGEVGSKISKSFLESLDRKVEVFDQPQFELLLSSIARKAASLPEGTT